MMGFKTIVVDADPQGNATSGLGVAKREIPKTLFDCLVEDVPFAGILQPSPVENLLVAPSNSDLLSAEWHLGEEEGGNLKFRGIFAEYIWDTSFEDRPEYIVIDCPPSLGHLSLNAILSSDSIIIPVQCEYYALEGLTEIIRSATLLRQSFNPALKMEGILLTMADKRLNLSRQVEEDIRGAYDSFVFQSVINRSVRLSEAPSHGLPIMMYDPDSSGSEAYLSLTQEVINHEKKSTRSWPVSATIGNTHKNA